MICTVILPSIFMRPLRAHLESSSDWARLSALAGRLLRLQRVYTQIVPAPLASSSQVAHYKKGKVVIHAANGAVAAKIAQMAPSLAVDFSKRGCEVTEVAVRVQVAPQHRSQPPITADRSLGIDARRDVAELCERLPEDSPVRSSLLRLLGESR